MSDVSAGGPSVADRFAADWDAGRVPRSDADLWRLWSFGAWAVIPTNTQRRADGTAVMGAGVARAAADRHPGLAARYGAALARGDRRLAVTAARVLLVPTKEHWRDPSTVGLVADAFDGVARWCGANPQAWVACPALGCGLGGLDFDVVSALADERLGGCRVVLLTPAR